MKFRVLPLGLFFMIVYDLLALICLGMVILTPSEKEVWVWIVCIIMFLVFPIIFSIYILGFSLDSIVIDENGIRKYHYGKMKKELTWDRIVTANLYMTNGIQGWVYLSDEHVNYNFFSSTFMMFDKKSICMYCTDSILTELNKYLVKKIEK